MSKHAGQVGSALGARGLVSLGPHILEEDVGIGDTVPFVRVALVHAAKRSKPRAEGAGSPASGTRVPERAPESSSAVCWDRKGTRVP